MATWTIIGIYEVPAGSQIQATDRMLEALEHGVERDYHVKDVIRAPGDTPGTGRRVSLEPPKGWLDLLKEQLLGSGEGTHEHKICLQLRRGPNLSMSSYTLEVAAWSLHVNGQPLAQRCLMINSPLIVP